jgi:hypothetical protein
VESGADIGVEGDRSRAAVDGSSDLWRGETDLAVAGGESTLRVLRRLKIEEVGGGSMPGSKNERGGSLRGGGIFPRRGR